MQEMLLGSLGQEDPLEEGMATHSSILIWKIPWTGAWQAAVHRVAKSWTQLSDSLTCHAGEVGFGLCPESNKAV